MRAAKSAGCAGMWSRTSCCCERGEERRRRARGPPEAVDRGEGQCFARCRAVLDRWDSLRARDSGVEVRRSLIDHSLAHRVEKGQEEGGSKVRLEGRHV